MGTPRVLRAALSLTDKRILVPVLIAQIALGLAAMMICLPSMQDWSVQLGVPQSTVQLTLSIYVLAFGATQLVWGPMSDRLGRRPVLLTGLGLLVAGLVLAALARDATMLIAARFVQGVGAAAGMVAARASVQDLFEGAQRTRIQGYAGMAMGVMPPLATVVGGQVHAYIGWQANFALMAVLTAGLALVSWRVLPHRAAVAADAAAGASAAGEEATSARSSAPSSARSPAPSSWWRTTLHDYARLLREPAFVPAALVIAFTAATWYAFLGAAPLVLGSYGVGPAGMGFYVMVPPLAYIGGNFVTTRLAHRAGGSALMLAGQCCTLGGVALMMLLAAAGVHHPLAFALPLALLGIGHGLVLPSAMVLSVGMVAGLAGAAAALTGLLQQVLGAASGYAVGFLDHHGPMNVGWVMLLATTLSLLSQLAVRGKAPGRG